MTTLVSERTNSTSGRQAAAAPRRTSKPLTLLYHHRTRSRDGQSVHIDALIGALREFGHTVVVVEPQRVPATQGSLKKRFLPKQLYEILEFCYSFVEFAKLALAALKHRPHALYQRANVFMLSGVWTTRLFGIPYLLEVNAPLTSERTKFGGLSFPKFAAWTERFAWRAADRVLPVTGVLAREIEGVGVPRNRIEIVPNGVDLDELRPTCSSEAIKQRLGLGSGLVLGFVGFVRDWHGLDHIVNLLASEPALSETRFLIVGDGPAAQGLREQAARLDVADRVVITGVVDHGDLPNYLNAIDIAMQPEVTPYASPLKLFEYMALGRAIIAPDTENIREVLEHDIDCLLFVQGDRTALAKSVLRLATDSALRARLGAAAAAKIVSRNLTWRRNAERITALVEDFKSRR